MIAACAARTWVKMMVERLKKEQGKTGDAHLKAPRPNRPDVEMVEIEVCLSEARHCPNPLIQTGAWQRAFAEWARERDLSERLRSRVGADRIKFHNKFRISISGCANGCSRPQIADVGIMGAVQPLFDPAECEKCGACAEVCPDRAISYDGGLPWFNLDECLGCRHCHRACPRGCITLSEPAARVLVGGKLGRRPRLADEIGVAESPGQAIALVEPIVMDYISNARPGERFGDFWLRSGRRQR